MENKLYTLISGLATCYPVQAIPGATIPYVVFRRTATEVVYNLQDRENTAVVFQVDIWGNDFDSTNTMVTNIQSTLDAYRDSQIQFTSLEDAYWVEETKAFHCIQTWLLVSSGSDL